MHRDPFSHNPPRKVQPSSRAQEARDRWLAAQGGEEAAKRRVAAGGGPSPADLASMATRRDADGVNKFADSLRAALANERARELRRARRRLRLAITLACLGIGSALALVVYYGILGYH